MFKKTLVAALALSLAAAPATAGSGKGPGHPKHKGDKHRAYEYRGDQHRGPGQPAYRKHSVSNRHGYGHKPRNDFYGGQGYRGGYSIDDRVFLWLGLTAIGLRALDVLSYPQRVLVEDPHWRAAPAPIGRPVVWIEGVPRAP
ncbi:MAG: hypothetical protein OEM05_07375 [Myxococcales bacterium]|nr:hypothetical protein [Myxococcales bacterium]